MTFPTVSEAKGLHPCRTHIDGVFLDDFCELTLIPDVVCWSHRAVASRHLVVRHVKGAQQLEPVSLGRWAHPETYRFWRWLLIFEALILGGADHGELDIGLGEPERSKALGVVLRGQLALDQSDQFLPIWLDSSEGVDLFPEVEDPARFSSPCSKRGQCSHVVAAYTKVEGLSLPDHPKIKELFVLLRCVWEVGHLDDSRLDAVQIFDRLGRQFARSSLRHRLRVGSVHLSVDD